jgi:hypothetical protein
MQSKHYACGDGRTFMVTTSKSVAFSYLMRGLQVDVVDPATDNEVANAPLSRVKGQFCNQWYLLSSNQEIR